MAILRRVDGRQAGAAAVGILIPPGPRTVLIVRLRGLPLDLLLTRSGEGGEKGTPFLHLDADDAPVMAEGLARALARWVEGGPGGVEEAVAPDGQGYWVQARLGAFPLVACPREPGRPYRPAAFATPEEAARTAAAITRALRPEDGRPEVYVNDRHFHRGRPEGPAAPG